MSPETAEVARALVGPPGPVLVELCAGTAAVSLWALGRCAPLTGYMGSKRRWADDLVAMLDADRPARVVLVDAGPWGETWKTLRDADARREVAALFDRWEASGERPNALWSRLVAVPPYEDPVDRAAQYLWLQARSAGTIPMWWSAERERWESPSGSRTEKAPAHDRGAHVVGRRHRTADVGVACVQGNTARGSRGGTAVGKPDHPGARGIQYPATIARRIRDLDAIDWSRVEVVVGDVRDVEPIPGARVLFDPPYLGAPRYAALCPRADVLDVARRWAAVARVVLCEAEPLPLEGWHPRRLRAVRRSREWVTCSWRTAGEQAELFGASP